MLITTIIIMIYKMKIYKILIRWTFLIIQIKRIFNSNNFRIKRQKKYSKVKIKNSKMLIM